VDIGPDGFPSCCSFLTMIRPNQGKIGCWDEI